MTFVVFFVDRTPMGHWGKPWKPVELEGAKVQVAARFSAVLTEEVTMKKVEDDRKAVFVWG